MKGEGTENKQILYLIFDLIYYNYSVTQSFNIVTNSVYLIDYNYICV